MKTFTPYEDPKPKLSIKKANRIRAESYNSQNDFAMQREFYEIGFKDGVKAHKKVVAKHANELMEHFGI